MRRTINVGKELMHRHKRAYLEHSGGPVGAENGALQH